MSYTDKQGREWHDLECPAQASLQYEAYRAANRKAAELREAFEAKMCELMGNDQVQFGYKFGKLSFTCDGSPRKAKAAPKAKLTLDQWLDQQATL